MAPSVGSLRPQFLIVGEFAGAEMKICRGSPENSSTTSEPNYVSGVLLHNQSYAYFEQTFFDFSKRSVQGHQ